MFIMLAMGLLAALALPKFAKGLLLKLALGLGKLAADAGALMVASAAAAPALGALAFPPPPPLTKYNTIPSPEELSPLPIP
jgi:hypothetical protein